MLTDIHGVSGRAMIEALIAGKRSPTALAELAKGRARTRRGELAEALEGRFADHHARLARMLLDQLDDLTARITEVTALLDAAIAALPDASPTTDPAASTDAHDIADVGGERNKLGEAEKRWSRTELVSVGGLGRALWWWLRPPSRGARHAGKPVVAWV